VRGRVGSLLEVGTGFHPELTGRENIYLNGAVLGMTRAEIERKFDEIVEFAEIEQFLDTPTKRFSSGMYMRLAFAVAAYLEPEILLVDEVLAVGDAAFQKKCLGKMGEVAKEGRTVLFVSHQMATIDNLCNRSILIDKGTICKDDVTRDVIFYYLNHVLGTLTIENSLANSIHRSGTGKIRFSSFKVEDNCGNRLSAIQSGMDIVFVFGYKFHNDKPLNNVDIGFSIHSHHSNQALAVLYSSYVGDIFGSVSGEGFIRCKIDSFPFAAGRYRIGGRITVNGIEADWPKDGIGYIDVVEGDFYGTGNKGFDGNVPFLIRGHWFR
jgi:lipopolysaccharide transport system ATP-binding protein